MTVLPFRDRRLDTSELQLAPSPEERRRNQAALLAAVLEGEGAPRDLAAAISGRFQLAPGLDPVRAVGSRRGAVVNGD